MMPEHVSSTTRTRVCRAVVIGAAGFIGTSLSALLTGMRVDTACFTRKARFMLGGELAYCLLTADFVFYLASSINPALGEEHPEWAQADHALFAELLRGLARMKQPPTVLLTSSGGTVYDPGFDPPYSELSPTRATGGYGTAKLALEQELLSHSGAVPGVILRLSNVYGPGQRAAAGQGVLAHWLLAAREGRPLRIIGDPGASRDYVYIDDVIDCMRRVLVADGRELFTRWGNPLVLNVGSGVPTSLACLAETVRDVVRRELVFEQVPSRRLDRAHVWLDPERARHAVGWQAEMPLADGIRAMWDCSARERPGR